MFKNLNPSPTVAINRPDRNVVGPWIKVEDLFTWSKTLNEIKLGFLRNTKTQLVYNALYTIMHSERLSSS